jgi:hypothetical protein
VKIILQKLFPDSYNFDHSISGKPSNSKIAAKICFDGRLYGALINAIKATFGFHIKTKYVTEKVHSVQKFIAKKSK